MPGIIDKVLNKIEGRSESNSTGTGVGRTGSVGSTGTGSAYDGTQSGSPASTGAGATTGAGMNGSAGTTGKGSVRSAEADGVGMTDATGERGVNGTGTHAHEGHGLGKHTMGHTPRENEAVPETLDAGQGNVHHDAIHLGHKTHERVAHPELEEVSRQREQERHVHHVQHHVQPVLHQEQVDEQHHQRNIPVTRIHEKHVNEDAGDREAYLGLGQHQDKVEHLPAERKVVDMGETVNETVHHHVHNVIQPIIQKETVAPTRIHTTVPLHHVVHEAPIVHSSIAHEPMARDDFLKQGGKLGEGLTHQAAGDRLLGGDCERQVDGQGEGFLSSVGIGGGVKGVKGQNGTAGRTAV